MARREGERGGEEREPTAKSSLATRPCGSEVLAQGAISGKTPSPKVFVHVPRNLSDLTLPQPIGLASVPSGAMATVTAEKGLDGSPRTKKEWVSESPPQYVAAVRQVLGQDLRRSCGGETRTGLGIPALNRRARMLSDKRQSG